MTLVRHSVGIGDAISIFKGLKKLRLPPGYWELRRDDREALWLAQNILFHNNNAWWERYTRRLIPDLYEWPHPLQNEAWWFYCGGVDLEGSQITRNIDFADYIVDKIKQNLNYGVDWLDE